MWSNLKSDKQRGGPGPKTEKWHARNQHFFLKIFIFFFEKCPEWSGMVPETLRMLKNMPKCFRMTDYELPRTSLSWHLKHQFLGQKKLQTPWLLPAGECFAPSLAGQKQPRQRGQQVVKPGIAQPARRPGPKTENRHARNQHFLEKSIFFSKRPRMIRNGSSDIRHA